MTPKEIAQTLRCCADLKRICPKSCPLYEEEKCQDIAFSKGLDVLCDYDDTIGQAMVFNLLADRIEGVTE